jgi:hypothetical protein
MQKVTGIGGVFFRARDPKTLAKWYEDVLGVDINDRTWVQEPEQTRFDRPGACPSVLFLGASVYPERQT